MKAVDCPDCGGEYQKLGNHLHQSQCEYPEFSPKQHEVLTGLLMGDGTISVSTNQNPCMRANMITKPYLEWLDDLFGPMSIGVRLYRSAEKSAEHNNKSDYIQTVNAENYSDQYIWGTRRTPKLQRYAEWYESGEKVWPDNTMLTPTVLKHWFVGDGFYRTSQTRNHIGIAMANERTNKEKVERMFMMGPGVTVSRWDEYPRQGREGMSCKAQFSVADSKKIFDYMGDPLPGFEYKWPSD